MSGNMEKMLFSQTLQKERAKSKRKGMEVDCEKKVAELRKRLEMKDRELEEIKTKYRDLRMRIRACTGMSNMEHLRHLSPSAACIAAQNGKIERLRRMLESHTDIHSADHTGGTSLHWAVVYDQLEVINFLLESGADLHFEDARGRSPFKLAVEMKKGVIAQRVAGTKEITKKLKMEFSRDTYMPFGQNKPVLGFKRANSKAPARTNRKLQEFFGKNPLTRSQSDGLGDSFTPRSLANNPLSSSGFLSIGIRQSSKKKKKGFVKRFSGMARKTLEEDEFESDEEEEESLETLESVAPGVPYGIAFGRLRGHCKVADCDCRVYRSVHGKQGCQCGHFPAAHENLGDAEAVKRILERSQKTSTETLVKEDTYQVAEWPKVFNKACPKYDGVLATLQDKLTSEKPAWIVSPEEVTFVGELGQGTAAKVYRGQYLRDTVALKMMEFSIGGPDGDRLIKDLETEFRIMSQVRSAHVVNLHGVVVQPRICMIVEFCGRGALYDVLKRIGDEWNWTLLLKWFRESVEGIQFLHHYDPQILHRDIKTLNLLVTANNAIKVADFGLSRFNEAGSSSTLKKLRGTYCYTAPEVYFREKYSVYSDVYSLGIVLWEMVTCLVSGTHMEPYSGRNFSFDFQIIIQAAKKKLRPTILPQTPKILQALIKLLWNPSHTARPDTKLLLKLLSVVEKEYSDYSSEWDKCIEDDVPPGRYSKSRLEKILAHFPPDDSESTEAEESSSTSDAPVSPGRTQSERRHKRRSKRTHLSSSHPARKSK